MLTHTRWECKTFNVEPSTLDSFVQILGSAFRHMFFLWGASAFWKRLFSHPTDISMSGDSKFAVSMWMNSLCLVMSRWTIFWPIVNTEIGSSPMTLVRNNLLFILSQSSNLPRAQATLVTVWNSLKVHIKWSMMWWRFISTGNKASSLCC